MDLNRKSVDGFLSELALRGENAKRVCVPILNGLIGDKLGERHPLNIQMSFRLHNADVSIKDLKSPDTPKVVTIFLHGLMLDESNWMSEDAAMPGYGVCIERDLNHWVLYVRYNSGRHISQNGQAFSQLLKDLVHHHGHRITAINVIGHSMGGLIVRSAGHYATKQNLIWINLLRHVIFLGAPHDGSHWEQLGHLTSSLLKTLWNIPTRVLGRVADLRSSGIKDLRFGFMIDEDWQHPKAGSIFYKKPFPPAPLPGVAYHTIVGSLSSDEASLLTRYLGDGLVSLRSAGRQTVGTYRFFSKTSHMRLLIHPEIATYLKKILMTNGVKQ